MYPSDRNRCMSPPAPLLCSSARLAGAVSQASLTSCFLLRIPYGCGSKIGAQKWNPGKWKLGLKPAVFIPMLLPQLRAAKRQRRSTPGQGLAIQRWQRHKSAGHDTTRHQSAKLMRKFCTRCSESLLAKAPRYINGIHSKSDMSQY